MKSLEIRAATVSLDDGILRVQLREHVNYSLQDAKETVAAERALTGPVGKTPVLVDMRDIDSSDADARKYFASPDVVSGNSAIALVVDSSLSKVIGNFFIGIDKPACPTKLFTSENDAADWLRGFRQAVSA